MRNNLSLINFKVKTSLSQTNFVFVFYIFTKNKVSNKKPKKTKQNKIKPHSCYFFLKML